MSTPLARIQTAVPHERQHHYNRRMARTARTEALREAKRIRQQEAEQLRRQRRRQQRGPQQPTDEPEPGPEPAANGPPTAAAADDARGGAGPAGFAGFFGPVPQFSTAIDPDQMVGDADDYVSFDCQHPCLEPIWEKGRASSHRKQA